jgi:hypothetical protein
VDMEYSWIDNDREKRKYSEKNPGSIMPYLPQITNELAVDRNRISAVRGRRLTALSVLRPAFVFMRTCDYINMVTTSDTDTVLTKNLVSCCNFVRCLLNTSLQASGKYFF